MRLHAASALLSLATRAVIADVPGTLQVAFTTDFDISGQSGSHKSGSPYNATSYGPDGPWQAVAIFAGNANQTRYASNGLHGDAYPVYPCGADISQLLTPSAGGTYGANNSTSFFNTSIADNEPADWGATVFTNSSSHGFYTYNSLTLFPKFIDPVASASGNATIYAANRWPLQLASGATYTNNVGTLGLGIASNGQQPSVPKPVPSITDHLASSGLIASRSFGLHMGSVPYNISGSLILGGYDSARVLGTVGQFNYQQGFPIVYMTDLTLGWDSGGSPFGNQTAIPSLIKLPTGDSDASRLGQIYGAPSSIIVLPNPAVPYIYLPLGNCEAVARYLPVTWNSDLALYLWNIQDPRYAQIVSSSAHMAFTFSDSHATNITIRVPFALLNLTLEAPLVSQPTPYWPCKPTLDAQHVGFWMLGRAFLQAAFLGLNFETNSTFMAQAPGPVPDQTVTHALAPSATSLIANPIDSYARSWSKQWTILPSDSTASFSNPPNPISGGVLAGIVIGAIIGVALLILLVYLLIRYLRRRQQQRAAKIASTITPTEVEAVPPPGYPGASRAELGGPHAVEAPSNWKDDKLPPAIAAQLAAHGIVGRHGEFYGHDSTNANYGTDQQGNRPEYRLVDPAELHGQIPNLGHGQILVSHDGQLLVADHGQVHPYRRPEELDGAAVEGPHELPTPLTETWPSIAAESSLGKSSDGNRVTNSYADRISNAEERSANIHGFNFQDSDANRPLSKDLRPRPTSRPRASNSNRASNSHLPGQTYSGEHSSPNVSSGSGTWPSSPSARHTVSSNGVSSQSGTLAGDSL